jgi:hypothetical protein
MEKTTVNTFLYHSTTSSGTFEKLVDITSYPDLFSAPEKLDISDMSSRQKKYTPGMVDVPDYEFNYIYSKTAYDSIKELEGTTGYYQLRFGANGEYGAWQWSGDIFTTPTAGSVGSAREAKLTCYPAGEIAEVTISTGTTTNPD